jgi:hypothetical protein
MRKCLHPLNRMVAGKFLKLPFYETRLYVDVGYFRVGVKWGRRHGEFIIIIIIIISLYHTLLDFLLV